MTINSTDITQYLLQDVSVGYEYRSSDEGYTANGSHYQNIIAKKRILTIKFRPLSLSEYNTIENLFLSTDEYTVVFSIDTASITINCFRQTSFSGTNVGDKIIKGLQIELKEI